MQSSPHRQYPSCGPHRRDVYFAVTVTPGFRDRPDGRAILHRYRIDLAVFSALVFAAVFAGVRQLGVAFMPIALVLLHTGTFAGFYRARQRVIRYAVTPAAIREADLGRRDRGVPSGQLLALGPFLPIAACAALLCMRGKEATAGLCFASVAGILAAFTILRYGMSHWARRVHAGGPELVKEMRFRRTASIILLVAEYLIAAQCTWIVLMPHHRNLMRGSNAGILVAEFAGLLILTLAAVLVLARMGQGGSRVAASRDEPGCGHAEPVGDRTEDRYWKLGVVYFNRDDAAVAVEKHFGLGYTLNFARVETWIIVTLLLVGPVIRVLSSRLHR
jgi:hypothetical protein